MSSSLPSPPKTGRLVGASLFMVGLRIAFRLIGMVSSLVLVRLLAPQDFGIVGLATAVASSLELLTEPSFALALIRLPDMAREHLDTAWTFQIMRGLLIGALVAASSGFAASWMDEPRVMPIMWVLAATSLIQGFENIGTVEFRRNLQFGTVFQARLFSKLVGLAVTLPLAVIFLSYWALVLGTVVVRVFLVGFSYYQHPYRPRLSLAK
jgi:O-antigen/teichoic acid export membrane protein